MMFRNSSFLAVVLALSSYSSTALGYDRSHLRRNLQTTDANGNTFSADSGSNTVTGSNNDFSGNSNGNVVTGNDNSVQSTSDSNVVSGNSNSFTMDSDQNQVNGNSNTFSSDSDQNQVNGSNNSIMGDSNQINGSGNTVFGDNNIFVGDNSIVGNPPPPPTTPGGGGFVPEVNVVLPPGLQNPPDIIDTLGAVAEGFSDSPSSAPTAAPGRFSGIRGIVDRGSRGSWSFFP